MGKLNSLAQDFSLRKNTEECKQHIDPKCLVLPERSCDLCLLLQISTSVESLCIIKDLDFEIHQEELIHKL